MSTLSEVDGTKIAEKLAEQLLEKQAKQFVDQMSKMQKEIESLKQVLSNKGDTSNSGTTSQGHKEKEKPNEGEDGEKSPRDYTSASFDYNQMNKALQLPSVNLGKPPSFDGINYNDWAHKMKLHLIAARAWEIVEVGLSHNEGEEFTAQDAFELQQNAQAASLILSCLKPEESTKVHGMEIAKQIWDTLKISFEGDASVRKCNIELLQGKIENFTIKSGETTQQMFDRYMTMINKIRALGDTKWDDNSVARKLLRAYRKKNKTLASIIMERPNYETMGPHEMLAKIKHHKVLDDEAIEDQEASNKKIVTFKANQEEGRKAQGDSSSEESDDSDEEIALLVKNFRRFMRKKMFKKGKGGNYKKRNCYECGADDHFKADCPHKKNKYNMNDDKKQRRRRGGEAHVGEEWYSDDDSSDEEKSKGKEKEKGAANIAIHKTSSPSLFANIATSTASSHLFEHLSDDEHDFTHSCFVAKDEKVPPNSPIGSCDESSDDDINEYEQNMIRKFGKKGGPKIIRLLTKLESRNASLAMQDDLISQEKEKNLALEASLAEEKLKVEKLTVELSLANDSNKKLTKECSTSNDLIANLNNKVSLIQESFTSLQEKYQNLELSYNTLWNSTSSTTPTDSDSSNASTSKGCKRCYKIDVNACATNLVELEKKDKEIQRLNMILKNGCKCKLQQPKDILKNARHPSIKDGIGYSKYDGKANGRKMVNGVHFVNFSKGVPLFDLMNKANKIVNPKATFANDKTNKKKQVEIPKQQVPISRSYASDYMCCWGKDGKIVVKYVGALKKREIMKSVWVPKTYVTNPLGPNSTWVPKSRT